MGAQRCVEHSAVGATHRCDGCGRLLCAECIEVGHRLLTCSHCGELAVPLASGPANALDLERARVREVPYTLQEALLFPFRGEGAFVFWATVVYVGMLHVMLFVAPLLGYGGFFLGLMVLILGGIILVMVPGLSFAIVRRTAAGDDQVPGWPDWSELDESLSEVFAAIVLGFLALMPAIFLVAVTDCESGLVRMDPVCFLVLILALVLGMPLWIPAFGAVAVFGNPWLCIRWDLHLRALLAIWRPTLRTAVALLGLYFLGALGGIVLGVIPLAGGLVTVVVDIYAWFVGMHLIGLMMRRHEVDLEPIYLR